MLARRIGIIDSGYKLDQQHLVLESASFELTAQGVQQSIGGLDDNGHGSAVLTIISEHSPESRFLVAKVLDEKGRSSVAQLVAALYWLLEQGVSLVNLSAGVAQSRASLHSACQAATEQGVLLFASSPAMGAPVYPASYSQVFSVTGDGRCSADQWSWLQAENAEFAAHVRGPVPHAGSSMACAHLSGIVAEQLARGFASADVYAYLQRYAYRVGAQQRE